MQAYVRFGSKTDISRRPKHVHFTPESGHGRRYFLGVDRPVCSSIALSALPHIANRAQWPRNIDRGVERPAIVATTAYPIPKYTDV